MPSAAKQRLPADLWRHNQGKQTSPVPCHHSQEMQASPGSCDVFQEKQQQHRQGSKRIYTKSHKRQYNATDRASPKSLPRRGSADALCVKAKDYDSSGSDTDVMSSSVKSDSCLSYSSSHVSDAYAMETSIAPHPSQLPLPPLEWLKSSSMRPLSPEICGVSLRAILGCQVAA